MARQNNSHSSIHSSLASANTGKGAVRPFFRIAAPYKGCPRSVIAFLVFALIFLIPSAAQAAWYNPNWQHRKAITIDGNQIVGGPHNDFPVLISITDTDLSVAEANGNDLLFTLADGSTKLNHEIEYFDNASGTLVAWVRIPAPGLTNGTDTTIYLYYDYDSAPNQQNVAGTWNTNYRGVWHLAEQGATPAGYLDSTANSNDGTSPTSHPTQIAGAVGPARDFDGVDDYIMVANDPSLQLTTSITLEGWVWVRPNGFINFCCDVFPLLRKGEANPNNYQLGVRAYTPDTSTAGPGHVFLALDQGDDGGPEALNVIAAGGTWYHLAATWDGTTERIFVNGSQVQSGGLAGPIGSDTRPLYMGARQWEDYGNGRLDELRISSIARPPQWIATQYNNQFNPGVGGFLSAYGAQETASPTCDVDPNGTYIEAENFVPPLVPGGLPGAFQVQSTTGGFNGSGYLISDSNGSTAVPPPYHMRADYTVNFPTPGIYMVWMRGYALDGASDSVWIGLDGTEVGALNEGGTYNQWIWSNGIQAGTNQINVTTAGQHTINLWVRESNHSVDGIYITTDVVSPSVPGGNSIGIPTGAAVIDPNLCLGGNTISGAVYNDINGDGNLADAVAVASVAVDLYLDGGDGQPDGGDDSPAGTATTDGSGSYSFSGLSDGTYWVVVDSKTLSADTNVWAEQTYGSAGAWCDNGSGTAVERAGSGACFGGQLATASDDASLLNSAQHATRVTVAGGDVSGVDFGFSFNAVVNTLAGDNRDDDGLTNRTVQGSLRQFIQNANAVTGANAMRFVPAVPTNDTDGTNNWWEIAVTTALPNITDANTTIDGTAYAFTDGVTIRDDNPTMLGSGGTVGVDSLALSQVAGPELEIAGVNTVDYGIRIEADDVQVRNLAIYGFGNTDQEGNIWVQDGYRNAWIEGNLIGSEAGGFSDPGAGLRTMGIGIYVSG
ncbi:MAG: DUF2341 domain-containing protein, partial [Deltaproteobacteria bacterium]